MAMASPQTRWTAAMVRALPDDGFRHEVIDGEHVVTPAPSWTHQGAVLQLARRLMDYLREHAVAHLVIAPADVELDEHNLVQPDLFVVPLVGGTKPRAWEEVRSLLLAVEVLSPSTTRTDRLAKRRLYQRHGVPEYWIIDVDLRVVERWRAGEEVGVVLTNALTWQAVPTIPPLTIELPAYFRDVIGEG
jgi:Uma2 family endonuclease